MLNMTRAMELQSAQFANKMLQNEMRHQRSLAGKESAAQAQAEHQRQVAVFHDVDELEDRFKGIKSYSAGSSSRDENAFSRYFASSRFRMAAADHQFITRCRGALDDAQLAVNNNQAAVAYAATTQALKKTASSRQIWSVPAGHGKSRIVAAIIVMAHYCEARFLQRGGGALKFQVAFSDRRLHDHDMATIGRVAKALSIEVAGQVPAQRGQLTVPRNTVLLIDEVDDLLIDKEAVLPPYTKTGHVIGLTATPFDRMLSVERHHLRMVLGFDIHDSGIQDDIVLSPEVEPAPMAAEAALDAFASEGMAILVWAGLENAERMQPLVSTWANRKGHRCRLNEADPVVLQSLTSSDILLVTEPALMRGFDYRCATGIALLVAGAFSSKRAYFQGCGRVGRYGEPCRRVKDAALGELYEDNVQAVTAKFQRVAQQGRLMEAAGANQGTLLDCFAHARGRQQ